MNLIEQLKNDLWNGIFQVTKKLLVPGLLVYLILVIVGIVSALTLFAGLFGSGLIEKIQSYFQNANPMDIQKNQDVLMEMIKPYFTPAIIGSVIVFMLIIYLVLSWITNFMLRAGESKIVEDGRGIGEILAKSFNRDVFRIMGFLIVFQILNSTLNFIVQSIAGFNPAIYFLVMLLVWALLFRFWAVPGAMVLGQLSLMDSIRFSWGNITFGRGFRAILVVIVFMVVLFLLFMLMFVFGLLGKVGGILMVFYILALEVFVFAFLFSTQIAAYFRYADIAVVEDETDHLLDSAEGD
ncbi:MAG: hypothetical protein GC181_02060 [Bacteroidetes bacterium]|nr:hypothetical protein [Bacteroidota bacterium]